MIWLDAYTKTQGFRIHVALTNELQKPHHISFSKLLWPTRLVFPEENVFWIEKPLKTTLFMNCTLAV